MFFFGYLNFRQKWKGTEDWQPKGQQIDRLENMCKVLTAMDASFKAADLPELKCEGLDEETAESSKENNDVKDK